MLCQYVTLHNVFTDNLWNVHIEQCLLVCYNLLVHYDMCCGGGGYGILMLEPTGQQEVTSFPTCKQEKREVFTWHIKRQTD